MPEDYLVFFRLPGLPYSDQQETTFLWLAFIRQPSDCVSSTARWDEQTEHLDSPVFDKVFEALAKMEDKDSDVKLNAQVFADMIQLVLPANISPE